MSFGRLMLLLAVVVVASPCILQAEERWFSRLWPFKQQTQSDVRRFPPAPPVRSLEREDVGLASHWETAGQRFAPPAKPSLLKRMSRGGKIAWDKTVGRVLPGARNRPALPSDDRGAGAPPYRSGSSFQNAQPAESEALTTPPQVELGTPQ
jgi:hypothetical protein